MTGDNLTTEKARMNGSGKTLSFLVVEDNPADRRLIEVALNDLDYAAESRCLIASVDTLADAIAHLKASDTLPDVVIQDLHLPDAVGMEALEAVRKDTGNAPVIVLTGLDDSAVATEALARGASDYLEKRDLAARTLWRAIRYAMEHKKKELQLRRLANSDPLTGILNRRAFFDRLRLEIAHTSRSDMHCGVLVFDIDKFKQINDLYGHETGDTLLVEIARRVGGQLRETDALGRIGGDEFAVIAPNIRDADGALEVARKIVDAVDGIGVVNGQNINPVVSVGIAIYPSDHSTADMLISHADLAMYKSKNTSRRIHYYDERMDHDAKARHRTKARMREDIAAGRFGFDYQPIVDARTGAIVAAEALARWRGNETVSPSEFIPLAESAGWINDLSFGLFDELCTHLHELTAGGLPRVPIAFNLSSLQYRDAAFASRLVAAIHAASIDPGLLNVEVTESTVIEDIDMAVRTLGALRTCGIGVHLDDFGTGYSSLSILKVLPLDALKIDRTFVADVCINAGSRQIVEAVASLARNMELSTVAEGVETQEQADLLRDVGIDHLQGYFFSRPLAFDEFRTLLGASCGQDRAANNGLSVVNGHARSRRAS